MTRMAIEDTMVNSKEIDIQVSMEVRMHGKEEKKEDDGSPDLSFLSMPNVEGEGGTRHLPNVQVGWIPNVKGFDHPEGGHISFWDQTWNPFFVPCASETYCAPECSLASLED